ncbi:MAG: sensor histidine kinase [Thermodesulfovibrionales bacterium]|nr:sensor histidine kinase [Thermodesulfovibrionales bacterium]
MDYQLSIGENELKEIERLRSIVESQEKALEALFAISDAIIAYPRSKALITSILEIIKPILNAKTVVFWSLNPERLKKCWEYVECGKVTCPAYCNDDQRCWSIPGTQCKPDNSSTKNFEEKMTVCFECPVLLDTVLSFEAVAGEEHEFVEKELTVGTHICKELFLHKPPIAVYHTYYSDSGLKCYRQIDYLPRGSLKRPELIETEDCVTLSAVSGPSTKIGLGLLTKNQLTGIVCMMLDRIHYLSIEEVSLLTNIARIISVAVENSHLYTIMEKKNRRIMNICRDAHHRIKNNLQILSGLFLLQLQQCHDPSTKELMIDNLMRVRSIAYVHQLLSKEDSSTVNLAELCEKIVESGLQLSNIENKFLNFAITGSSSVSLDSRKATNIAIIVNELVTNSIKHGFRERLFGRINVKITDMQDGMVNLEFSDNGIGFPADFDLERDANLGLRIVSDIVREDLNGCMKIESERGARIKIIFKL